MTVPVEDTRTSRTWVAAIAVFLLVELTVSLYVLLAIWPNVASIPNVSIVASSDAITGTSTTSSTVPPSSTSSSSTTSTQPPPSTSSTTPALSDTTPSSPPGQKRQPIDLFCWTWENPSPDSLYLVTVMVLAALGALVHALTSLATWRGKRRFDRAWTWWYIVRVPVAIGLGLIFYAVIRGGLLSVSTDTSSLSPYGIAGIAALTGMFAKQVTDKLRSVFDALFGSSDDAA